MESGRGKSTSRTAHQTSIVPVQPVAHWTGLIVRGHVGEIQYPDDVARILMRKDGPRVLHPVPRGAHLHRTREVWDFFRGIKSIKCSMAVILYSRSSRRALRLKECLYEATVFDAGSGS